LNKSFNELIKKYQNENADLLNSSLIEDWEEAYFNNNDLLDRYSEGWQYLDQSYNTIINKIESENKLLKEDISKNYYELGKESMLAFEETGDKRQAQDAYYMFSKVGEYSIGNEYGDLNILVDRALMAGTVNILVEAESWEVGVGWEIDQRFDDIERVKTNDFVNIYFERSVENLDCRIELDFARLDVDRRARNTTENFSEEIIDGYQTVVDTSGVSRQQPIYKTVNGSVGIEIIERTYRWSARATIDRFNNQCDFRNQTFDAVIRDEAERYDLSGDERAIPDRFKVRNGEFRNDEDEIIESLIDDIYLQFKRYYF